MKALSKTPCFSPLTWKCLLVFAHLVMDVIFITVLVAEVFYAVLSSIVASLSHFLFRAFSCVFFPRSKSKRNLSSPVQS